MKLSKGFKLLKRMIEKKKKALVVDTILFNVDHVTYDTNLN